MKFVVKLSTLLASVALGLTPAFGEVNASELTLTNVEGPGKRVVAYVTSWSDVMPSAYDMTNVNYAFGHVNDTFNGVTISNPERLRKITSLKRENPQLQVQLSIGGWGSGRFSEMAANPSLRKEFAADCRRIVEEYNLDGIDIDWEYPTSNAAGISSSPADTENFTFLMKDLREALPKPNLLTLASVHNANYIDFAAILPYVDFVNIMSYDMATPPYHHSPLYASEICGENSAENAVKSHIKAGVPPNMLTLGIPFYGRGKGYYNNFVDYKDIVIKENCELHWDSVAQAPYITDDSGILVLGYDTPQSITLKCEFIRNEGLLGAMYWDYAGDIPDAELRKTVADNLLHKGYPADYASAPRFNALIYYSDMVEEAHRQFAEQAIGFIHKLSYGEGFTYSVTTSLAPYTDKLGEFDIVIALNNMPHEAKEREAFENYMRSGGGWMGFHAAGYNDGGTHWEWFNEFLGAGKFYCNTWPPQPALLEVKREDHAVTKNLPVSFVAPSCEWYQWQQSPVDNPDVDVLLSLSPKNYPIGIKDIIYYGEFPVVWTNRNYRMIYLNIGHGDEEFSDATQNLLLVNSLRWIVSGCLKKQKQ